MQIRVLNKEEITQIKAIAKKHGINWCKKGTFFYHIGRQCHRVPTNNALAFISDAMANGFYIDCHESAISLAKQGLFDSAMVAKVM